MNEFAIGSKHFAWTVIGEVYSNKHKKRCVECRCECGSTTVKECGHLLRGKGKQCASCSKRLRHAKVRRETFWQHIDQRSKGECWDWQGSLGAGGYGSTSSFEFGTSKAHRVAYMYANNTTLTSEQHVMHSCDNRKCCNPNHLSVGTHADNMKDMKEKGRRKGICVGADNGRAIVNQEQADEIRRIYAKGGISQEKLGNRYGLTQTAVSAIILNKRFTDAA